MIRQSFWFLTIVPIISVVSLHSTAAGDEARLYPRIANGNYTEQFPSVGAVVATRNSVPSLVCSGTLVGCQTFITAAHCITNTVFAGIPVSVYLPRVGIVAVSNFAVHPSYDPADPNRGEHDIAVLRLARPVIGVAPTAIETGANPGGGTVGTVVGFGTTSAAASSYGIRRFGNVSLLAGTLACAGYSTSNILCWFFENPIGGAGTDSNICNKDSGSPLFAGGKLAGVNYGLRGADCAVPPSGGYASSIFAHATWIQSAAAPDVLNGAFCSDSPEIINAADVRASVVRRLGYTGLPYYFSVDVKPGTTALRFALNATDNGAASYDLFARRFTTPSAENFDCVATRLGQFEGCELISPQPGIWWVGVFGGSQNTGSGDFQAYVTELGPDCSMPGYLGRACDDANPCTQDDVCTSAGTCEGALRPANSCISATRSSLKWDHTRRSLAFKWSGGPVGTDDFGDPTKQDRYTFCIYDANSLVERLDVPAGGTCNDGDPCWVQARTGYKYLNKSTTAPDGINKIVLKPDEATRGQIVVRAKELFLPQPDFSGPDPFVVQVHPRESGTCVESRFAGDQLKQHDSLGIKGKAP